MARPVVYRAENGRDILGLSREQYTALGLLMRRYFSWVESGRRIDPWESHVAGASRFDQANSLRHKSNGSGPGKFSPPDVPTDLLLVDDVLPAFSVVDRLLFQWHWRADEELGRPLRAQEMADRLNITLDMYKSSWNQAKTRLFCKLSGL